MRIKRIEKINLMILKNFKFAEFVGILLGDGHVHKKGVEITIDRSKEKNYAKYIAKIIHELFGKQPRIRQKNSSVGIVLNSKVLVDFLVSVGLKSGKKGDSTKIPIFIFNDNILLKNCVKGLMDTDGGIHKKQNNGNRYIIEFKNASNSLRKDTENALRILGFTTSKSGINSIRIQHQNEVKKYITEIGSSNEKNSKTIERILHQ